ncbi:MAG TPA: phage holin family protein [Chitinophagales bacterium]
MNFIIQILVNAAAVFGAAYLLSGIHVKDFKYAIVIAVVLALLNTYVKPFLQFISFPITILSLGLFLLFINAAIIMIASWLIGDGFKVDGWLWALAFSFVMALLNALLESLIG